MFQSSHRSLQHFVPWHCFLCHLNDVSRLSRLHRFYNRRGVNLEAGLCSGCNNSCRSPSSVIDLFPSPGHCTSAMNCNNEGSWCLPVLRFMTGQWNRPEEPHLPNARNSELTMSRIIASHHIRMMACFDYGHVLDTVRAAAA